MTGVGSHLTSGACGAVLGTDLGICVSCTNTDGSAGDGTSQGTCPTDELCFADGNCGRYF